MSCLACGHQKVHKSIEPPKIENIDQDLVDQANYGDSESCYILSRMLLEEPEHCNSKLGEYYLSKSADSGFGEAILYYSKLLHIGIKIPKNDTKAKKYLKSAIKKGIPKSAKQLSKLYFDLNKNKKGVKILKKSVKNNDTYSMIYLSKLYQEGTIVEQNNARAIELLTKAHQKENQRATNLLAEAYRQGQICTENLNKAADLHKENAKKGDKNSLYSYAEMLENGEGVEKNLEEAIKYYELAAKNDNPNACYRFYEILLSRKTENDEILANEYLEKAFKFENPEALYKKGMILYENKEKEKAKQLFYKSAMKNNKNSEYFYGNILIDEGNYGEAYSYLLMAANQGHKEASIKIGLMIAFNIGCSIDPENCLKFFLNFKDDKLSQIGIGLLYNEKAEKSIRNKKEMAEKALSFIPLIKFQFKEDVIEDIKKYAKKQNDFYQRKQPCSQQYAKNAYNNARRFFKPDSPSANAQLGGFIYYGFGCRKDPIQAKKYIEYASNKKNAEGLLYHGIYILEQTPDLTEEDIENAVNLFGKSSILGNVEATFFYAVALLCGYGIDADLKKAAIYFKKAADFENIPSSYIYATMSECGIGISQKDIEAASFYYEGAIKDNVESTLKYAIFCYEGKGIKKDKKEALKWFKKAADLGNQTAKAICLYNVITGEEEGNIEDSINELNEISNNGDFYASYLLGCCYENGYYYKADEKKSIETFEKASNNGNIDSTIKVIEYDEKGIINKDAKYYKEKKNPLSQLYYGKKCLKSQNEQTKKEGLNIIKKLSDDNYLNPMIEYGRIQLRIKFNEGYELLKKSSELIPKVDCSDYFHLENIEFKTNMIVNMHMDYNYPDINLNTIHDWIPVIAETITNASEFNIDEIDFISGKGNNCSNFCMSQILVLLVTKRLGYVSYIDPTNQGIIICQVKLGKIEFKKENNDNEIRSICPEMPDECIDIIMTNIPQSEIQKFVTDFENKLQIQKYIDLSELNENRELRINQQYEGLKHFNLDEQFKEDIIKKAIKGNVDKIVDILNRIQREIAIDFLPFFHEILMKYDIPINSLLDIMKKERYNTDNILQRLKEQSTIGLQKFYCLKQMSIYNRIQSYVDEYTPRIAPLIEIDLRNAKLEDAKSSIDEIMNAIRYEKYCAMSLLFSTNEIIQINCTYDEIDRFIKDKANLYVFEISIRNKYMSFQEMKQMNVNITNLNYT